jgi:drug/metabolite transporter (DMT)-like permease
MLNAGERRVDAGTAAMLVGVGPILIAILAGALLREGFPRMLLAGVAVAFAGVVVIGFGTAARSATTAGIVLCVASAVAYAAAAVAQKVVLRRLAPLPTILLCCAIGVAFFLPWTPQLVREAGDAPAGSFAWIVFLGLFPTALGFVTWAFALSRTDAGRLGATTYLVPPLSVLLGWLWLGETPAGLAYLGGALCLAGVAIGRSRRLLLARLVGSRRGDADRPPARDQPRTAQPDCDAGAA